MQVGSPLSFCFLFLNLLTRALLLETLTEGFFKNII